MRFSSHALALLATHALALLATHALATLAMLVPKLAFASEIDAKTGALKYAPEALRTYSFESTNELVAAKASLTKWDTAEYPPKLLLTPVTDPKVLEPHLAGAVDALEGTHGLRLGSIGTAAAVGITLEDEAFFKTLVTSRVEITIWGRAEGIQPTIGVAYGKPDWSIEHAMDFASVVSTRTGRVTSDGWVEYTTGPIDGAVWGMPIRAIGLTPSQRTARGASFVVDALEIKKVPGSPTQAIACTQQNIESTCGAMGDCLYGRCVSSAVTWGALPPPAHRLEIVDRWTHIASRLIGDRKSSEIGRTKFTTQARDLARYALSSRQFFGGLNRLVNGLRDNHTSFGSPPSGFSTFGPMLFFGWSGGLHACFGVMDKDLMGGGVGYGVFHVGNQPISGVQLKKGDFLVSIDGMDPKAWADAVLPGIRSTSPNDPEAEYGPGADDLSAAITARATTITLARCASATKCKDADYKEFTIDIAAKMYAHVVEKGGIDIGDNYFGCTPRFHPAVDKLDEYEAGNDTITAKETDKGILAVQFDGFSGQDPWQNKMTSIFEKKPAKVLMDTRVGHGGYGQNVQHLLDLMRGEKEPVGFMTMVNGGWDEPSPAKLIERFSSCLDADAGGSFACFGAWGFFANHSAPPGGASKIAWLNTSDVSANDYMPKLLAGRSNFRIFAPHPTSGAFGAVTGFSSLAVGWGGGSIQYQDSRFGKAREDLEGARWESGHGVPPDQKVVQKQSDALNEKDTLLTVARAWLAE